MQADPLLLLAAGAVVVLAVVAYRRLGWPGVSAVLGGALALVVGAIAWRRRPAPPTSTATIDAAHRREVEEARADYAEAEAGAAALDARIEAIAEPATDDERAARRAAREAEVRARGGR